MGKTQFCDVLVLFIGAGEFQTSVVGLLPGSFVESWSSVHMVVMVLDKSSSFCNISIICQKDMEKKHLWNTRFLYLLQEI